MSSDGVPGRARLPIVHHPAYDAISVPDGHRFPMRKYTRLAERLVADGFGPYARFARPIEAPEAWLTLAHEPSYVAGVLAANLPVLMTRRIGFEVTPSVARRARASVAGTVLAGRLALEHGFAVNAAGGSHHAGPEGGAGFCVFNDVAVAARLLQGEGSVRRIAIIDLDVHQGDGTARIFAGVPSVFTFSMHCEKNWPTRKAVSDLDVGLPKGAGDDAYLEALGRALPEVMSRAAPDLVFYNAGVDPHAEDRLGLLTLSDRGLAERDRMVVRACKASGVPMAGVIGGGYSDDVDTLVGRHMSVFIAAAQALG